MSEVRRLPLTHGVAVQSGDTDNAVATATAAGIKRANHTALGYAADYSAAPAAGYKTVTFKVGGVAVLVLRRNFANGGFMETLPAAIKAAENTDLSVELQASGTAGVTGRVTLFHISPEVGS